MATPGNSPTTSLSEAKAALGRRDYHRAIEKATEAIAAQSKEAPAYLIRAEALRKLGQHDRALADLAVAIRLDPDRPSPYIVRAEILKRRCQFDQAIADATHALFLAPDTAAAYSIRATCREAIGDAEGAAADSEALFRLDPTRPPSPTSAQAHPANPHGTAPVNGFRAAMQDDNGDLFADGKPVDRTYRSRPALSRDDAGEVLGEVSGYKPGYLPQPPPRGRSRSKSPSRGMGYGLGLLGVGVVVGCLLTMRSGGTPSPGREPRPPRVSATVPLARADDGGGEAKSKALVTSTGPPDHASDPIPKRATTPSAPPPPDTKPKSLRVQQIRFTMAEDGDCQLLLDTRDEGLLHEDPQGEPATLAGVTGGVVRKTEAGTHHIVYPFAEVKSTADFGRLNGTMPQPLDGVSIDRTAGTLVMTPVSSDKSQGKKAKFTYPRQVRPPISVAVDFEKLAEYTFVIQLESQTPTGILGINVSPRHPPFHEDAKVEVFWIPVTGGKRGKNVNLLEREFEPEKVSEYGFHIPVDPGPIRDRFSLAFGLQGQEPVSVKRLEVEAVIPASFGMSWDVDKGKLRMKTVLKGGPSERAGLQSGDVLVSMDGEQPSDLREVMARLGQSPIGNDVKMVILRGGKEKAIVVKGE